MHIKKYIVTFRSREDGSMRDEIIEAHNAEDALTFTRVNFLTRYYYSKNGESGLLYDFVEIKPYSKKNTITKTRGD